MAETVEEVLSRYELPEEIRTKAVLDRYDFSDSPVESKPTFEDPVSRLITPYKHPYAWAAVKTLQKMGIVTEMFDPEWQKRLKTETEAGPKGPPVAVPLGGGYTLPHGILHSPTFAGKVTEIAAAKAIPIAASRAGKSVMKYMGKKFPKLHQSLTKPRKVLTPKERVAIGKEAEAFEEAIKVDPEVQTQLKDLRDMGYLEEPPKKATPVTGTEPFPKAQTLQWQEEKDVVTGLLQQIADNPEGPVKKLAQGSLQTYKIRVTKSGTTETFEETFPTLAQMQQRRNYYRKQGAKVEVQEPDRVFKKIAEFIESEDFDPHTIPAIFERYNITPEQLATDLVYSASEGARYLNQLSRFKKSLMHLFPEHKDLLKIVQPRRTWYDGFWDHWIKWDNRSRMMMVGQIATAARNFISQQGRYGLNVFDDALQGAFKVVTGKEASKEAFEPVMADVFAVLNRLSSTKRKKLDELLRQYPVEAGRLLSAPVHDIALGDKISRFVMFLNRSQEYLFRKMTFDAKITAACKKAGIDPFADEIPEAILRESVDHALTITFAKPPAKGTFGNAFIQLYGAKYGPLAAVLRLIQPFPRFYMNALKMLWDFNPTGFIDPVVMRSIANVAKGKPVDDKIYQALSRATLGTMMLGTALAIRMNPKIGGEKWYDLKIGKDKKTGRDRQWDTRAFAPFATYLFLSEALIQLGGFRKALEKIGFPDTRIGEPKLTGFDWAQGIISINRIAGTGLVLVDFLRARSASSVKKQISQVAGNWMGRFSVPIRSIKDIAGGLGVEGEKIARYVRDHPLMGPFLENLPIAGSKLLKPAPRLTRPEPYKREALLTRQFSGLTIKTKTELEKELDRLTVRGIWPRTGEPTLDRIITERASGDIERMATRLIQSPSYQQASDPIKEELLKDTIAAARTHAKQEVTREYYLDNLMRVKEGKRASMIMDLVKRRRIGADLAMHLIVTTQTKMTPEQLRLINLSYKKLPSK